MATAPGDGDATALSSLGECEKYTVEWNSNGTTYMPAVPWTHIDFKENEKLHVERTIVSTKRELHAVLITILPPELFDIIALFVARPRPFAQIRCDPDTSKHRKRTVSQQRECRYCRTPDAIANATNAMCHACAANYKRCQVCGGLR